MTANPTHRKETASRDASEQVFTVFCDGSAYGLPIGAVLTIFRTDKITPAPLAPPEIIGLINLRGKIVTAAGLRRILGLCETTALGHAAIDWKSSIAGSVVLSQCMERSAGEDAASDVSQRALEDALAVCIEWRGEQIALVVDDVGDVVSVSEAERIVTPPGASGRRGSLVSGAFRLQDMILPVLDIDTLFDFDSRSKDLLEPREKEQLPCQ